MSTRIFVTKRFSSEKDITLMAAYHRKKIARQQYWRKITQKARYLWGER